MVGGLSRRPPNAEIVLACLSSLMFLLSPALVTSAWLYDKRLVVGVLWGVDGGGLVGGVEVEGREKRGEQGGEVKEEIDEGVVEGRGRNRMG